MLTKSDQLSSEKNPLRIAKESLGRNGKRCGKIGLKCAFSRKRENKIEKRKKEAKKNKTNKLLSYEGGLCMRE